MKKTLLLTLFCLCFSSIDAQTHKSLNGIYVFEQAELTIVNYNTKEVVEKYTITDIADIDVNNMHLENLFLQVNLMDGEIEECILIDKQQYRLDDEKRLTSASKKEEFSNNPEINDNHSFRGKELPPYVLEEDGERLTIIYPQYNFGQSAINFTMQAELVLTMTKQTNK